MRAENDSTKSARHFSDIWSGAQRTRALFVGSCVVTAWRRGMKKSRRIWDQQKLMRDEACDRSGTTGVDPNATGRPCLSESGAASNVP